MTVSLPENRCQTVLSSKSLISLTEVGREFQAWDAAAGNAWSLMVARRVGGTTSVDVVADRRRRRPCTSVVNWSVSARYGGAVPWRQRCVRTHKRNCNMGLFRGIEYRNRLGDAHVYTREKWLFKRFVCSPNATVENMSIFLISVSVLSLHLIWWRRRRWNAVHHIAGQRCIYPAACAAINALLLLSEFIVIHPSSSHTPTDRPAQLQKCQQPTNRPTIADADGRYDPTEDTHTAGNDRSMTTPIYSNRSAI